MLIRTTNGAGTGTIRWRRIFLSCHHSSPVDAGRASQTQLITLTLHRRAAVAELSVLLVVCSSSKHQGLSVVS
jgi:hypothetical protein